MTSEKDLIKAAETIRKLEQEAKEAKEQMSKFDSELAEELDQLKEDMRTYLHEQVEDFLDDICQFICDLPTARETDDSMNIRVKPQGRLRDRCLTAETKINLLSRYMNADAEANSRLRSARIDLERLKEEMLDVHP